MKKLVTILGVLALVATPALAVTKNVRHHKTHKIAQARSGGYGTGNVSPYRFNPQGQAVPIQPPTPSR
jgi:hypothetical protein